MFKSLGGKGFAERSTACSCASVETVKTQVQKAVREVSSLELVSFAYSV